MARIRTIKPEFPHSESMGRVSRDARLLFVQLWTVCDDSGRARGNSRMLASLLFPYDDDAPALIDSWLSELEAEGCLVRYLVDGSSYLQICNWLNHQKIDKPSPSKFPEFDESSRILANPREHSSLDQGPRTEDQGKDQGPKARKREPAAPGFALPDWLPKDVWDGFAEMRKRIKAPLTDKAAELIVRDLEKLKGEGHCPVAVIEQSISRSWRGVFPLKSGPVSGGSGGADAIDFFKEEARKAKLAKTHGGSQA